MFIQSLVVGRNHCSLFCFALNVVFMHNVEKVLESKLEWNLHQYVLKALGVTVRVERGWKISHFPSSREPTLYPANILSNLPASPFNLMSWSIFYFMRSVARNTASVGSIYKQISAVVVVFPSKGFLHSLIWVTVLLHDESHNGSARRNHRRASVFIVYSIYDLAKIPYWL